MEKDQIIIFKNRGLISIFGDDALEFLQNIITNDINKVTTENSIFSALLTPQGKYPVYYTHLTLPTKRIV